MNTFLFRNLECIHLRLAFVDATDDDDLRRTLQSLACGKKKLLLKEPPGRDVNDGDMFLFNDKFVLSEEGKKAGYKIHVNSIQAKVSVSSRRILFLSCPGTDRFTGQRVSDHQQAYSRGS